MYLRVCSYMFVAGVSFSPLASIGYAYKFDVVIEIWACLYK